jgi:hypothetical protein
MPRDPAARGSVFVSTTSLTTWKPIVTRNCTLYRYEIFSPGGINVTLTLGNEYHYATQGGISFVGGISPQYIRTTRVYSFTREHGSCIGLKSGICSLYVFFGALHSDYVRANLDGFQVWICGFTQYANMFRCREELLDFSTFLLMSRLQTF